MLPTSIVVYYQNIFLWERMMKRHPFHLVDHSPWPFTSGFGSLFLVSGLVRWIHGYETFIILSKFGALILGLTIWQWWRDVRREATMQGKHTRKVEVGLRLGMLLFIVSEIFFFYSFFWAYFHSTLGPRSIVCGYCNTYTVRTINPFHVPLLNTLLLLGRGSSMTWVHIAVLAHNRAEATLGFAITVSLGAAFTGLQILEYTQCPFSISDSVYGSSFYLATGFHGLHVIIGTIFIVVIFTRHLNGHFSARHHLGLEARAWYWHFVDVIWLFLFICIYWWSY